MAVVVCPPAWLLAQTVPLLTNILPQRRVGAASGVALTASTAGSVLGAAVLALVVMQQLGVAAAVLLCAASLALVVLAAANGAGQGRLAGACGARAARRLGAEPAAARPARRKPPTPTTARSSVDALTLGTRRTRHRPHAGHQQPACVATRIRCRAPTARHRSARPISNGCSTFCCASCSWPTGASWCSARAASRCRWAMRRIVHLRRCRSCDPRDCRARVSRRPDFRRIHRRRCARFRAAHRAALRCGRGRRLQRARRDACASGHARVLAKPGATAHRGRCGAGEPDPRRSAAVRIRAQSAGHDRAGARSLHRRGAAAHAAHQQRARRLPPGPRLPRRRCRSIPTT